METNRQLRLFNRKKGKPGDGTGPGSRTELTDKGCRVLTIEEAGCGKDGQRKVWKPILRSNRLGGERREKAFEQAMAEPPMGGICEHSLLQNLDNLLFSRA